MWQKFTRYLTDAEADPVVAKLKQLNWLKTKDIVGMIQ